MERTPTETLLGMVNGFQVSQALHAAVVLGVPDQLAEGARTPAELAAACDADEVTLRRLLRALAGVGVLHEHDDGRVSLTELGQPLLSDAPGSLAGWVRLIGRPYYWDTWTALPEALRKGENAFRLRHGTDVWAYRASHPEEGGIFDGAMTALTGQITQAVLAAYDFSRFATVVDVGGSRGILLRALLNRHPTMRGVLFDQPHVVEAVAGGERLEVAGGSFFDAVPAGGDAYVLKMIIHDWEDDQAIAILRVVRAAMAPPAAVLVIERRVGPPNAEPAGKFSDLNMLVMPGGRERTHGEYAALFEAAGLRMTGVTPAGPMDVIEAGTESEARRGDVDGGDVSHEPLATTSRTMASTACLRDSPWRSTSDRHVPNSSE